MKIRTGFVSNSSSSSFLVGFKNKPKTEAELRKLMFGDLDGYIIQYDCSLSIDRVVSWVFRDLENLKPLTEDDILEEISSGYFPGYPEYDHFADTASRKVAEDFVALFNADKTQKPITTLFEDRAKAHPRYEDYYNKYRQAQATEWETERKQVAEAVQRFYRSIKPKFNGLEVYRFEYSDNDSADESLMEHGGIFERLPHVSISHH